MSSSKPKITININRSIKKQKDIMNLNKIPNNILLINMIIKYIEQNKTLVEIFKLEEIENDNELKKTICELYLKLKNNN
jgi:hypothetical protein